MGIPFIFTSSKIVNPKSQISMMARVKLAAVWLGSGSGCHMSFLDLDEWLFDTDEAAVS
jgi:hypothetical protein